MRRESLSGTQSPVKTVSFQRGNSRVMPLPSPRGALTRLRPSFSNQKYLAAQQQARKPSNPIKKAATDEDEWQDVEEPKVQPPPLSDWPDLKPPTKKTVPSQEVPKPNSENDQKRQPEKKEETQTTVEASDITESNSSTSFSNFSPTTAGASFIRKLGRQSKRFRPRSWRMNDDSLEEAMSRNRGFHSHFSPGFAQASLNMPYRSSGPDPLGAGLSLHHQPQQHHQQQQSSTSSNPQTSRPFWMDPNLPGLSALYSQVSFNMIMVFSSSYAIGMFYATIRNDVNLKVEEYSVDIVDQISKCSFEYSRNGCEPGKRVPAIESACQQWERCMQRDPKEVGRAKVSAETFGTIIEAFIQPIGFKSMIFLTIMFAGSFLLVNAVFSSRIGPRFSASQQQYFPPPPAYQQPAPSMGQAPPEHNQHHQATPVSSYQPAYMQSQPSVVYTPAHIPSPRYRDVPLQSSPVRHSPYRL